MEATVAALLHLGRQPAAPDLWVVNESELVRLYGKLFTRVQVTEKAQEDAQRINWRKAAEHPHSKGLEEGIPNFEAARKATRYFRKHNMHKEAQALENVVVGIYRPRENDGQFGLCHRCAKRVWLSRRHDLYECFDNKNISHMFFKYATLQLMAHRANIDGESCFWMRGIVPYGRFKGRIGPSISEARVWESAAFVTVLNKCRCGFSDGTGGGTISNSIRPVAFWPGHV